MASFNHEKEHCCIYSVYTSYYLAGVLKTGKSGTIAMGLVPKNYPPNRQPGWNVQSIGYHADDGG